MGVRMPGFGDEFGTDLSDPEAAHILGGRERLDAVTLAQRAALAAATDANSARVEGKDGAFTSLEVGLLQDIAGAAAVRANASLPKDSV